MIVPALAVENLGASGAVEFGQAVEGKKVIEDAGRHLGNGRTARHVDHRLVGNDLVHRLGARGMPVGGLDAAAGGGGHNSLVARCLPRPADIDPDRP